MPNQKGALSREFISLSCSCNGSPLEPSAASVASAKVPSQRNSGVMIPGVQDGKKKQREVERMGLKVQSKC